MSKQPLEGIRICDLSTVWSGPLCTAYLGGLGAEVIKIESIQRPDSFRFGTAISDDWWEIYGPWNCVNVNKYDVTLDLNRPSGVDLFKRLVSVSDVVIENFTPRVLKNFNLTYEVLREVRPNLIMISMPGYGTTGPQRDLPGYAVAFEQTSGLASITGYINGPPLEIGGASDPIVGMHAAFAIMVALEHRRRTGEGQLIEVSQLEALTCLLGAPVADYDMNKRVWGRLGNRDPVMAPHGIYRCKGQDMWVAIAISSDAEWKAFCQAIGNPQLAQDERFVTLINRLQNQDHLDRLIEAWTLQHDYYEAMDILQKAGVAAGALTIPERLHEDPHFKEVGFFKEMTRDITGTQLYTRWPIKFSETPLKMRPAPKLGEHNDYVLGTILGLSKAEIEILEKEQIIGTVPIGLSSSRIG